MLQNSKNNSNDTNRINGKYKRTLPACNRWQSIYDPTKHFKHSEYESAKFTTKKISNLLYYEKSTQYLAASSLAFAAAVV